MSRTDVYLLRYERVGRSDNLQCVEAVQVEPCTGLTARQFPKQRKA